MGGMFGLVVRVLLVVCGLFFKTFFLFFSTNQRQFIQLLKTHLCPQVNPVLVLRIRILSLSHSRHPKRTTSNIIES